MGCANVCGAKKHVSVEEEGMSDVVAKAVERM